VFIQGWEYYGGIDAEIMSQALKDTGLSRVSRCDWRVGNFPCGCIDREQHRPYSLYFEAGNK